MLLFLGIEKGSYEVELYLAASKASVGHATVAEISLQGSCNSDQTTWPSRVPCSPVGLAYRKAMPNASQGFSSN